MTTQNNMEQYIGDKYGLIPGLDYETGKDDTGYYWIDEDDTYCEETGSYRVDKKRKYFDEEDTKVLQALNLI